MSTSADYQIKKKMTGGYCVNYVCPHCSAALNSALVEAGTSEHCPTCQRSFVVPGKKELEEFHRQVAAAAAQKANTAKQLAEHKRLEEEQSAKQRELAMLDEAEAARLTHEREQRQLFVRRRQLISGDRDNERQSLTLQIALFILLVDAALSAIGAVFATLTVIGIPIAVALVINFAGTVAVYCVIVMINSIKHSADEAVAHLRFQSSLLSKQLDQTKRKD